MQVISKRRLNSVKKREFFKRDASFVQNKDLCYGSDAPILTGAPHLIILMVV